MSSFIKSALPKLAAALIMLVGFNLALIISFVLSDKSWMATVNALGTPGATTRIWFEFIVAVIAAFFGLMYLLHSFIKKDRSK